MSQLKRTVSCILVAVLLAVSVTTAFAVDNMADAIKYLSSFLSKAESVQISIDSVISMFADFGNKDKAVEFGFYAKMVKHIVAEQWDEAVRYAKVLETMEFDKYITSDAFEDYMESFGVMRNNYSNIRPVTEARHYINGRIAENEGRMEDAYNEYVQSYSFYDGGIRLERCMGVNTDTADEKYRRALQDYTNGDLTKALQELVTIKDKDERAGALYDIIVSEAKTAAAPNQPAAGTNAAPTAPSAPATAAPATAAPKPAASGHWSSWSDVAPSSGKIETKEQYRYRTIVERTTRNEELPSSIAMLASTSYEFGSWSDWTDTPISPSATVDVETRTVSETSTVTKYTYTRYQYIGKNGNHWYAAYDYSSNSNYVRGGNWQSKTVDAPLAKSGMVSHSNGKSYQMYKDYWFNEQVSTQQVETGAKTQYRGRAKVTIRLYYGWSSWSEWADECTRQASSSCEVQTRTLYRSWIED